MSTDYINFKEKILFYMKKYSFPNKESLLEEITMRIDDIQQLQEDATVKKYIKKLHRTILEDFSTFNQKQSFQKQSVQKNINDTQKQEIKLIHTNLILLIEKLKTECKNAKHLYDIIFTEIHDIYLSDFNPFSKMNERSIKKEIRDFLSEESKKNIQFLKLLSIFLLSSEYLSKQQLKGLNFQQQQHFQQQQQFQQQFQQFQQQFQQQQQFQRRIQRQQF